MRTPLSRFELTCAAVMVAGVALRLLGIHYSDPQHDAYWYFAMGKSLVQNGEFVMEWIGPDAYMQHYPPAFPALLALFIAPFGVSIVLAALVSTLVAALLVAVALATTWDLYGRTRGFAVGAVVAVFPTLVRFDLAFLGESLVAASFALTIWAIVKSLDKPGYILAAGLFAALGYLTKASMGPFFLLAGAGGFAWRFYYVRWKVFTDRYYMAAAALFATIVAAWTARNVAHFGWARWETQPHATESVAYLFTQAPWGTILAMETIWSLAIVTFLFALPFLPEIARSWRTVREERTSVLWLSVVTPTVVAILFASAFFASEQLDTVKRESNVRYLITPIVPLLWLGMRALEFPATPMSAPSAGRDLVTKHRAWLAGGVGVVAFLLATNPIFPYLSFFRIGLFVVGALVGLVAILIARGYEWKPLMRTDKDGATRWRAVSASWDGAPVGLPLFGFGIGVVLLLYFVSGFFAFVVAGTVALAIRPHKERVLALCACFFAMSLVYAGAASPAAAVAADLDETAAPGATVATNFDREKDLYPFVESVRVVSSDKPHDYYAWLFPPPGAPAPEGYQLVKTYPADIRYGPGTTLGLRVWGTLLDDQTEGNATVANLYQRIPASEVSR